ncbi:MAG TPA: NAD(P)H-hydrate epimerase [Candidatus Hydrogenedens sp.]|mgnify:CR=1 FL=1|nr:NAD(P)H-hydrate epimerase [Candidatus Hydrogenedens sp.]HOK09226.1 NAD(P)H-hydrate epimerase [Candidatus Hydrogenedens sp.]HOL19749.1 NAD(P)H-hydrate epimerase [Candidatus Hydrogenedens sp.]HPP59021.1 NAD(P)H-hydrate epimerase [Candidatus Hydrogenedens sp.]
MQYLTVQQMREADRRCIEELGIPGVVLMNNAGNAVFRELEPGPVTVICGKGNNGGDGFVVARLALVAGWDVKVLLLTDPSNIRGDAEIFMKVYLRLGGKMIACLSDVDVQQSIHQIAKTETCVDALLGTGTKGEVTGLLRTAIENMNRLSNIISVDLPSGMNADTGEICGVCVRARKTVTFQYPKIGFKNPSAKDYLGELVIADIGIPPVCADDNQWFELKQRTSKVNKSDRSGLSDRS